MFTLGWHKLLMLQIWNPTIQNKLNVCYLIILYTLFPSAVKLECYTDWSQDKNILRDSKFTQISGKGYSQNPSALHLHALTLKYTEQFCSKLKGEETCKLMFLTLIK